MKRIIITLAIIFCAVMTICADTGRFYKDGRVVNSLYVDSPEGLRVRDNPSLSAKRLCAVPHRIPLKVVAIGQETVIDGIAAPWVEVLIPRYEWKGSEPEYGWVFGGYLSAVQPKFSADGWGAKELSQYLTGYLSWAFRERFVEQSGYMHFYPDGTYSEILCEKWGSYLAWEGTWKALSGREFSVTATNREGETRTKNIRLDKIFEQCWWVEGKEEGTRYGLLEPDEADGTKRRHMGVAWFEYDTITNKSIFNSRGVYFTDYYECTPDFSKWPEDIIRESVAAGIFTNMTIKQYNAYWEPIMKEHQEKINAAPSR